MRKIKENLDDDSSGIALVDYKVSEGIKELLEFDRYTGSIFFNTKTGLQIGEGNLEAIFRFKKIGSIIKLWNKYFDFKIEIRRIIRIERNSSQLWIYLVNGDIFVLQPLK